MPATTRALFSGVLFSLVSFALACVPPWHPVGGGECSAGSCGETDTDGDADDPPLTTTSTVTGKTSASSGDDATSASASSDTGEEMTTGDVDGPPKIREHELSPATLFFAGALTPKIWVEFAGGVRMHLDGADVELTLNPETGAYEGEIPAYSGYQNGDDYVAVFTPWRSDGDLVLEGEALELPYAIALHDPGEEDLFDIDTKVGVGNVTALATLPTGEVVELLTLMSNGSTGCFLRRRSAEGVLLGEIDPLLPDHCKGIDLEVHKGAMVALLEGETLQGGQWFLARVPSWGAHHTVITTGELKEVAHDLAISTEGTIAVCGAMPTSQPHDLTDAMVRIIRPDSSTFAKTFDHAVGNLSHLVDESARGCEFDPADDDRLVIAGEVYGELDKWDNVKRNRSFDVIYDVEADHGELRVASAVLGARQSFASDVAFAEGHAFVLGYVCGDDGCGQVEGRIWTLDGDGDLTSTRSLGIHSSTVLGPSRIRVSPAGYLIVTSGGLSGADEAFLVRAYDPFKAEPLFTYVRKDAGLVHLARALTIGTYGQIYAGGFGADGYPLFVIVYG